MSNIIKCVDFGMGYTEAGPGDERRIDVSHWDAEDKKWVRRWHESLTQDTVTGFDSFRVSFKGDGPFRRPLPILANHPEAIPLEPGEVLQVGDRGLTRDGRDTGELEQAQNTWFIKHGLTFYSQALNMYFRPNGYFHVTDIKDRRDIIARLPKVAKEAELPKLEIVACDAVPPGTILAMTDGKVVGKIINVKPEAEKAKEEKVDIKVESYEATVNGNSGICIGVRIPIDEAARIAQLPEVQAYNKRQEEAKRIGPLSWYWYQGAAEQCARIVGCKLINRNGAYREICDCVKIENPALIAALNAEIDAKAGG